MTRNKIKVVLLCNYPISGELVSGSPVIFDGITKALNLRDDIELSVISVGGENRNSQINGINVYQIKKNNLWYIPFFTFRYYSRVKSIINDIQPDIIHAASTGFWYSYIAVKVHNKYPVVTTVLGILAREYDLRKDENDKKWVVDFFLS